MLALMQYVVPCDGVPIQQLSLYVHGVAVGHSHVCSRTISIVVVQQAIAWQCEAGQTLRLQCLYSLGFRTTT